MVTCRKGDKAPIPIRIVLQNVYVVGNAEILGYYNDSIFFYVVLRIRGMSS